MKLFRTSDLIVLGALGAGLYYLSKKKDEVEKGLDEYVAAPIADAWISIFMPGHITLTGTAVFPNGYKVSMSQLNIDPTTLTFNHLGQRYRIDHREGDNYIVVPT